jgi:acyl transferase domain-containing protein
MGITHPSGKGQETVVRMAYEKAGLDPNATAYAELHGTGTPVGDPIEVRAIASAMNDTRSAEKPLLLGAVCFSSPGHLRRSQLTLGYRLNRILATARPLAASLPS